MLWVLGFLPLAVALGIVGLVVLASVHRPTDRLLSRIARAVFRDAVAEHQARRTILESAYIGSTYHVYAAKTYLYAVLFAAAGGIISEYVVAGIVMILPAIGDAVAQLPRTMWSLFGDPAAFEPTIPRRLMLWIVMGGGFVGSAVIGLSTYALRWQLPKSQAELRRRGINESLTRTVAFMYALSRGGVPFPEVMRTLSRNRHVYGDTADEITVAVRDMDVFGTDVISAIREMSRRTPSEDFKTFSENLASVLQSGQELSGFLHDQYDRYQQEAKERQTEVLELLATIAEAYVTVLVAGTLFLVTILLVFGLTMAKTLWIVQLLAYLGIPLANLGFMVFVDQQLDMLGMSRGGGEGVPESELGRVHETPTDIPRAGATDGGTVTARNDERLSMYDSFRKAQSTVRQPLRSMTRNPTAIFYLTLPMALVWIVVRFSASFSVSLAGLTIDFPSVLAASGVNVRTLDDVVIMALLFVLGTFALVREPYKRRLERIEAATPELLERLASLNEAGTSIVQSIDRVRRSDLGVLTEEVERIWRDIELGATVDEAFLRFGARVQTTPVTRAVTLITNAMSASGNLGTVVRIASRQARADLRMRRQRKQQMFTYLIVVYISFFVFLVIIIAVEGVLVPSLPNTVPTPSNTGEIGISVGQFTRFGGVDKAAYTLVFFHTALVQAVLSGFIAGQLGEGTLKDGAKHAAAMLLMAYVAFLILSSPTATVAVTEQYSTGESIQIQSASLSNGGFVAIHEDSPKGEVIGYSALLPAGTTNDVRVELREPISEDTDIAVVPYLDSNDNGRFDQPGLDGDKHYPPSVEATAVETAVKIGP